MLKLIQYVDYWELFVEFPDCPSYLIIRQFESEMAALEWIRSHCYQVEELPLEIIRRQG